MTSGEVPPGAPPRTIRLPGVAALAVGDSRAFPFERSGQKLEGFILRHSLGFFAYVNVCPHWFVNLDLGFGDFYAADIDRIFCRNHGALFLPTTGECTAGPCAGLFLESLPVALEGDDAVVTVENLLSVATFG